MIDQPLMYQSIPAVNIPPGEFFWEGEIPTPWAKRLQNPDPRGKNSRAKKL